MSPIYVYSHTQYKNKYTDTVWGKIWVRLLHFIFKSFTIGKESHKVFLKIVFDSFLLLPTTINKNIVSSFITTNYSYPFIPHPTRLCWYIFRLLKVPLLTSLIGLLKAWSTSSSDDRYHSYAWTDKREPFGKWFNRTGSIAQTGFRTALL